MAYDFGNKTLTINGEDAEIAKFVVVFATPFGVYENLNDAVARCKEIDFDPTLVIQPTIAIVDHLDRSEIFLRNK